MKFAKTMAAAAAAQGLTAPETPKAPKVSLRRHLHQNMAGYRPGRPLSRVHASNITYEDPRKIVCTREYALWDLFPTDPAREFLSTALVMTFDIGSKVEDLVRGFMGPAVVGNWNCVACGRKHTFCQQPPECDDCGCGTTVYEEVRFVSKVSGISCGIDALFDEGTGKYRIVESKSIDKDQCKALVAPMAEHRIRTSLYLRIIAESDSPYKDQIWTDEGLILYTSKGGFGFADDEVKTWGFADDGFSPFKEYRVTRNDELTEPYVKKGMAIRDWRVQHKADQNPPLPPRLGCCKTTYDKRARNCSNAKACFAQDTV